MGCIGSRVRQITKRSTRLDRARTRLVATSVHGRRECVGIYTAEYVVNLWVTALHLVKRVLEIVSDVLEGLDSKLSALVIREAPGDAQIARSRPGNLAGSWLHRGVGLRFVEDRRELVSGSTHLRDDVQKRVMDVGVLRDRPSVFRRGEETAEGGVLPVAGLENHGDNACLARFVALQGAPHLHFVAVVGAQEVGTYE